jgi:bifunctional DNA-binding transcriptional regulator/antitoxin component of YhaV-PrlF toxin-antitoxin module
VRETGNLELAQVDEEGVIMERRIIRKRWQVTIPREVRRRLNLFQGQLLNWDIHDFEGQTFIRVYTGGGSLPEDEVAFHDILARKKGKKGRIRCRTKIRKLDMARDARMEAARNPQRFESSELSNLVSNLSQYLLGLQERLRALPGD